MNGAYFCGNCGQPIEPGDRRCWACGIAFVLAAAHIVRQHRTGFVAGIDFTDDSRFITWGGSDCSAQRAGTREDRQPHASADPYLCAEHPACAVEGAVGTVDYGTGLRQSLGRHVTDKVLAVLFGAAVAYVALTWGSPL